MKQFSAFVILLAGLSFGMTSSLAQSTSPTASHAVKKSSAKKTSAEKKEASVQEEDADVKDMPPTALDCELGNKLTIYGRTTDDEQIAVRWNKHVHRMTRVSTTTGAHRFENSQAGLVWIDIPAKGMLLDSKKGKQLANECKRSEHAGH